MDLARLRTDARRWGWGRALYAFALRAARRRLGFRLCRVRIREMNPRPAPDLPPEFSVRVLSQQEVAAAAADPELGMSPAFVAAALERGDIAVGAFHGTRLVAYAWRTFTAAPHFDGLWVEVRPPYLYGYKGFTQAAYRGMRLNTAVSSCADPIFIAQGYDRYVALVDADNLASIRAGAHKGTQWIGFAGHVKWFGRCFVFRSSSARRIGLRLLVGRSPPSFTALG